MAQLAVDISLTGDRALLEKLAALGKPATQKKAVRPALRAATKRLKAIVVSNLSGRVVTPQTGRLLAAISGEKVHAIPAKGGIIGTGFDMPRRSDLGIEGDDEYYPAILEFGHEKAPAKSYLRAAVDDNKARELAQIGRDIGKGIEKQAAKKR